MTDSLNADNLPTNNATDNREEHNPTPPPMAPLQEMEKAQGQLRKRYVCKACGTNNEAGETEKVMDSYELREQINTLCRNCYREKGLLIPEEVPGGTKYTKWCTYCQFVEEVDCMGNSFPSVVPENDRIFGRKATHGLRMILRGRDMKVAGPCEAPVNSPLI